MTRSNLFDSSATHAVAAACGLFCLALFALGCDTVAEISVQQRDFRGAVGDGVNNAASCAVDSSDVQFVLGFTPFDGDGTVIAPGEVVNGQLLELGSGDAQFGDDDIEFVDSVLYPPENVPCTESAQCAAPFTCQPLNPANRSGSATVCGLPVQLETLQSGVVYDEGGRDRFLALLVDTSASLAGIDEDGNFDPSRATDPRDQRIAAARLFTVSYQNSPFGDDSEACVVSFGGEDAGGVFFSPTPDSCMTPDFDSVSTTLAGLGIDERGGSPVWSALEETISQQLAPEDGDRIVLLFTDGPDDSSVTANFDSVLAAATSNSVRVHIVHLDNPPDAEDVTGPIDAYARLACATGGSYQYATSPDDLRNFYDVLSNTVPTSYEVEGQIIALGDPSIDLAEGCYRLSTTVSINLAGQENRMFFAGDKTDPATLQVIDDRLVVCKRPVPVPSSDNGDGGGGGSQE